MNTYRPDHAFILAAGRGTRMRPLTNNLPKPLVPIQGRPILDYILEKLKFIGVKNITINSNYCGDRIKEYIEQYQGITITHSSETQELETGGGVKNAIHTMQGEPFYLINGDAFWVDNDQTALGTLADHWNPEIMDILLLLQPVDAMRLTEAVGDYDVNEQGIAVRSLDKTGAYMFAGIRICNPIIFDNSPEGAFSFLALMDEAEKKGRLYGVPYDGQWHHISTPEDLIRVNEAMDMYIEPHMNKKSAP